MSPETGRTGRAAIPEAADGADWALTELRRRVIVGVFSPGEQLRQDVLAEGRGVSRLSVRENLRTIEREEQLAYEPHRGTFVVELNLERVDRDQPPVSPVIASALVALAPAASTCRRGATLRLGSVSSPGSLPSAARSG